MLNPNTRNRMKELSITKGDEDILLCMSMGDETSTEIALTLDCPVQTISMRLKTLRAKGYLTRTESKSVTGGVQYHYKTIYKIGESSDKD